VAHEARVQKIDAPPSADAALALAVLDRHPYGILVEDVHGRLVAHNQAAGRMVGDVALLDAGQAVGCTLLRCRTEDGPVGDACVHERARRHVGPLPEMRVDLPPGAGVEAAWVTVTALEPERDLILTELRPGRRSDRRRRSEPHWMDGPRLRIFALGRTRVMTPESRLDGRWLDNRAGQILKFLVAERHRIAYSDEIVERLWPNAGAADTRGLRYFIHVLREHLEPDGVPEPPSSFVLATRGGYVLDERSVWIDADVFEDLVEAGISARERGDAAAALSHLDAAMRLYGGDFLADEPYAEWAVLERERLREMASDALRVASALSEELGDIRGAAVSLRRLADLEPYDIDVHRQLLVVLLREGRRSEALRRYEALRRRLLATFHEQLDFSLAELLQRCPERRSGRCVLEPRQLRPSRGGSWSRGPRALGRR
jgi:DNA-binding SARP family transcriptional activator